MRIALKPQAMLMQSHDYGTLARSVRFSPRTGADHPAGGAPLRLINGTVIYRAILEKWNERIGNVADETRLEAGEEREPSRYVVGIDLGTTNSAMTSVDTAAGACKVRTLVVPQLVAPGQVESRETLPSFHYESAPNEFPKGSLDLPWQTGSATAVGVFAREQGRLVPGRVIDSAKSWLCHTGVDRTAELLPWHGAADVARLSPVEVSSRYLAHLSRGVGPSIFPKSAGWAGHRAHAARLVR